jgi:type II restriction endonuclease EcoO109I-like protein
MSLSAGQEAQIKALFTKFLQNIARSIRRLRIQDLNINPFLLMSLARELGFNNAKAIVKWLVGQRLERTAVTCFGNTLQDSAKSFSEGIGVEGADILKTKAGRHYYIQVKSGPNAIPKEHSIALARLLRSAQRRNAGSVALLGICYGNRNQVSSIIRRYVQTEGGVDWKCGREFWAFISDDPNCMDEIYRIAREAGEDYKDDQGQTVSQILRGKLKELERQFETLYGKGGDEMWKKLLEVNS